MTMTQAMREAGWRCGRRRTLRISSPWIKPCKAIATIELIEVLTNAVGCIGNNAEVGAINAKKRCLP